MIFQFHKVRLKAGLSAYEIAVKKFQFHKVRLKAMAGAFTEDQQINFNSIRYD